MLDAWFLDSSWYTYSHFSGSSSRKHIYFIKTSISLWILGSWWWNWWIPIECDWTNCIVPIGRYVGYLQLISALINIEHSSPLNIPWIFKISQDNMAPSNPQPPIATNKKRPKTKGNISVCITQGRLKAHPRLGCYQCSRRRIDCDRQHPTCRKCKTKGLECSGLGIRYRFNRGLASRGKLVGETIPTRLSYGGETDAGRSSPINVKSGSWRACYKKDPNQVSQDECTARHGDQRKNKSDDTCTAPQCVFDNRKDGERTTENDKDASVMISKPLIHFGGETEYLMQYCIVAFNEWSCYTELIVFKQSPNTSPQQRQ